MTIHYDRGNFTKNEGRDGSISATLLMKTLTGKIMDIDLGKSTLLLQAGMMVAPIFVTQVPPMRMRPWWEISVVQYHSVEGNLRKCRANVWNFISLESLIGQELDGRELLLAPKTSDKGMVAAGLRCDLKFEPSRTLAIAERDNAWRARSLINHGQRLPVGHHRKEIQELVGEHGYGILTRDQIRDDYPARSISEVIEDTKQKYTLESEINKIFEVR